MAAGANLAYGSSYHITYGVVFYLPRHSSYKPAGDGLVPIYRWSVRTVHIRNPATPTYTSTVCIRTPTAARNIRDSVYLREILREIGLVS